jgi:hypothetical protein
VPQISVSGNGILGGYSAGFKFVGGTDSTKVERKATVTISSSINKKTTINIDIEGKDDEGE